MKIASGRRQFDLGFWNSAVDIQSTKMNMNQYHRPIEILTKSKSFQKDKQDNTTEDNTSWYKGAWKWVFEVQGFREVILKW